MLCGRGGFSPCTWRCLGHVGAIVLASHLWEAERHCAAGTGSLWCPKVSTGSQLPPQSLQGVTCAMRHMLLVCTADASFIGLAHFRRLAYS